MKKKTLYNVAVKKLLMNFMVFAFLLQAGWAQAWLPHGSGMAGDALLHTEQHSHDENVQNHHPEHLSADGGLQECQQHHACCAVILGQFPSAVFTAFSMAHPRDSIELLRDFWAVDIDKPKWAATTV